MTSKIGGHFLGRGATQSWIDSGLMVGKWVNNDPPANLPAGFVAVWRWVEQPDSFNDKMGGDPEEAAEKWIAKQLEHINFVPKKTIAGDWIYIEGPNENNCENATEAAWGNRFWLRFMQIMEGMGRRACIGSFGTGRPSLPIHDPLGVAIWTEMLPMLRHAEANDHTLGMHAYSDDDQVEGDDFKFLRHRKLYAWLPPGARPDLIIGEWGVDGKHGRFRSESWRIRHADPNAAYMQLIAEYDREVQKDPYVLGFTIFTTGTNSSVGWEPFDIADEPLETLVASYLRTFREDGGTPMFNKGQTVFSTGWPDISAKDVADNTIYRVPFGTEGRIMDGPMLIPPTDPPEKQKWLIDWPGQSVHGWTGQPGLSLTRPEPPPPPSNWTRAGTVKPLNHHSIWVCHEPEIGLPKWRFDADALAGGRLVFEGLPVFSEGRNWYHVTGVDMGGKRWFEGDGYIPCFSGDENNWLEVYPTDGKPHPDCKQQIIDVPDEPPPHEPPPPPPIIVNTAGQIPDGGFERGFLPGQNDWFLPVGWGEPWYADENVPLLPRQDIPFRRPHIFVHPKSNLTEDVQLNFPEGNMCLFIRGAWFPIWTRLPRQVVLNAGIYQPRMEVLPDPVAEYSPKRYGQDPITSRFRLYIEGLPVPAFVDQFVLVPGFWQTYAGPNIVVPETGIYNVILEYQGVFGMRSNGAFFDNICMVRQGVVPPPDDPPDLPPTGLLEAITRLRQIAISVDSVADALETLTADALEVLDRG